MVREHWCGDCDKNRQDDRCDDEFDKGEGAFHVVSQSGLKLNLDACWNLLRSTTRRRRAFGHAGDVIEGVVVEKARGVSQKHVIRRDSAVDFGGSAQNHRIGWHIDRPNHAGRGKVPDKDAREEGGIWIDAHPPWLDVLRFFGGES